MTTHRGRRNGASRPAPDSLPLLLEGWELSLRAANKSFRTVDNYLEGGRQLLAFLERTGRPTRAGEVKREDVEGSLVDLAGQRSAATVATRYRALQQFFKWLVEDGEIDASPMENMRPPAIPEKEVPVLSEDDLRRLLKACSGRSLDDLRDTAIIYLFFDTACAAPS